MINWFLPTTENNYTPKLLSHKFITLYTFLLLVFNIATSNAKIFAAVADVDSASILELHNEERESNGLGTLTLNSKLTNSAKAKAQAMMAADCWDHYCPDGKSPWEFIEAAGYDYTYAGENLAEGFSDNQKVFDAWMNSKTHRENILREDFQEIGIAIEYGEFQGIKNNALIVVHFATAQSSSYAESDTETSPTEEEEFGTTIISPTDGAILSNNTPIIEGESEDGTVEIYTDNEFVSEATADEGIFTYKYSSGNALIEGDHTVKATHTGNQTSDSVDFTIDTISPEIISVGFDSALKEDKQNYVVLSLQGSVDINQISTSIESLEIEEVSEGNWNLKINYEEFEDLEQIEISVFDEAGNSSEKTVNLTSIKGVASNKILEFSDPESRLFLGIDKVGLRRSINIVFALFIMILIVVDYLALTRMSIENTIVKKHIGHHFSVFALLLLIALAGGTTGELLDGVNS